MAIIYIVISRDLRTNPKSLDRQLVYSLGVGMFSLFLLIFWLFQYSIYHTIIYWRIVKLF